MAGPYVMVISVCDFENLNSTLEKALKQENNIDSSIYNQVVSSLST